MKFALFLGCNIPARLFNCCGYPVRNLDHKAFVLASARNLALAAKKNLNVISLCKCCYGSLKKADHLIKENASLRAEINKILSKEGLQYNGDIKVKHLLSVLYHDVGIETLKEKIEKTFTNLNIATHYGCHVLRPSKVVQFDDPRHPYLINLFKLQVQKALTGQ